MNASPGSTATWAHTSFAREIHRKREQLRRQNHRRTLRARIIGSRLASMALDPKKRDLTSHLHEKHMGRLPSGDLRRKQCWEEMRAAEQTGRVRYQIRQDEAVSEVAPVVIGVHAHAPLEREEALLTPSRIRWHRTKLRARLTLRWVWDGVLHAVLGYGWSPHRALIPAAILWALGAGMFYAASTDGAVKPNNAFILRAPEWVGCAAPEGAPVPGLPADAGVPGRAAPGESQVACWARQPEAVSWPRFQSAVYALDTLLPIVDLEMQEYWIPDENASDLGAAARVYLWLHIGLGWALSLFAVAGVSGLVKSD